MFLGFKFKWVSGSTSRRCVTLSATRTGPAPPDEVPHRTPPPRAQPARAAPAAHAVTWHVPSRREQHALVSLTFSAPKGKSCDQKSDVSLETAVMHQRLL